MSTVTVNALNVAVARGVPAFKMPNFVQVRASLPDMPAQGTVVDHVVAVAAGVAAAAVPFGALCWMFVAL
jgi:hypothetical protein